MQGPPPETASIAARGAAHKAGYVAVNLSKNAVAPVVLPLIPNRGSLGMDGRVDGVLRALGTLATGLSALEADLEGAHVVELGPGRTPHLMMALILAGARRADGFDVDPGFPEGWKSGDMYAPLASALAGDRGKDFLQAAGTTPEAVAARFAEVSSREVPIDFHRYDGHRTGLPTGTVDLIYSKSVLEHVDRRIVESLLRELRRVIKPEGGMIHSIDLRDHMWISGDENVNGDWLDALRYPDWLFRAMFSNRSTFINRLRAHEWRDLFEATGFRIRSWRKVRFPFPRDFSRRRLREPWRGLPEDELSIGRIHVVLTPA